MKNIFKTILLFSLPIGFAHAATIGGTYQNRAACDFGNENFLGEVQIPTGKVVVTENIPYSSDFTDNATASILIQSNDVTQPKLALRIGRHQPFAYGSAAYSMGTYQERNVFQETYYGSNGTDLAGNINLGASENALVLYVTSPSMSRPVTCTFNRQ